MAEQRLVALCVVTVATMLLCACGDDGETSIVDPSGSGGAGGGGDGLSAPCPDGEVPYDGGCIAPGVAADGCATGFEHDGDGGCRAIVPADDCPDGQMAIPGETSCREIISCLPADFSGAPVDGTTEYVDASYSGPNPSGSLTQPWTTITDAVAAAAPGAIVAIGAGTYTEDVIVAGKAVRLLGRCPSLVTIEGQAIPAAVHFTESGSEVRGVAVTGPYLGVLADGAENIVLEDAYVHDLDYPGVMTDSTLGPSSLSMRNVLVERTGSLGVQGLGGHVTVDQCVVRHGQPAIADMRFGRGVEVYDYLGTAASLTLSASVISANRDLGVAIGGAPATISGVVVRDTISEASSQSGGRGINIQPTWWDSSGPPNVPVVTLDGVVVEHNRDIGVFAAAAEVTIINTTVSSTAPDEASDNFGRGVNSEVVDFTDTMQSPDPLYSIATTLTLTTSTFQTSQDTGVRVGGSDATIDRCIIRSTGPRVAGNDFGDGLAVTAAEDFPASALVSSSRIVANHRAGAAVWGGAMTMSDSVLSCNALDLNGEEVFGLPFDFGDGGNNSCGCDGEWVDCRVLSTNLVPPPPAL